MDDAQRLGIGDPEDSSVLLDQGMPDAADDGTFSIGPPQPVVDSRELPAVSPDDEAGAVQTANADLGDRHPDNLNVVPEDDTPPPNRTPTRARNSRATTNWRPRWPT